MQYVKLRKLKLCIFLVNKYTNTVSKRFLKFSLSHKIKSTLMKKSTKRRRTNEKSNKNIRYIDRNVHHFRHSGIFLQIFSLCIQWSLKNASNTYTKIYLIIFIEVIILLKIIRILGITMFNIFVIFLSVVSYVFPKGISNRNEC